MLDNRIEFESRDLDKRRLSEKELDELIGARDYQKFLNTRNELYRRHNMKLHPPTRAQAIRLMAREPNLIRRPLLVRGSQIVFGFTEDVYKKF